MDYSWPVSGKPLSQLSSSTQQSGAMTRDSSGHVDSDPSEIRNNSWRMRYSKNQSLPAVLDLICFLDRNYWMSAEIESRALIMPREH